MYKECRLSSNVVYSVKEAIAFSVLHTILTSLLKMSFLKSLTKEFKGLMGDDKDKDKNQAQSSGELPGWLLRQAGLHMTDVE
jgi:hypothetical protein